MARVCGGDIETPLEDGNSALVDTFLNDRPKKIWHLSNFVIQQRHRQELLEDYANAPNRKNTLLYREVQTRLSKYPDEEESYYLPQTDEDMCEALISGKSFLVYLETLRWLMVNNETDEMCLLLYRGLHYVTLNYKMRENGYLDVLKYMMQIQDDILVDEFLSGDAFDWLRFMPEKLKVKLKNVETIGCLTSKINEQAYANLRTELLDKHPLDVSQRKQDPWALKRD